MKKKIISILPYCFFLFFSLFVFFAPFGNGDELWNYNFGKKISEGLKPYSDINMIPTPLSAYISAIFIKLFGGGVFAYRIAGYVLIVAFSFALYHLCLKISQYRSLAIVFTTIGVALNSIMYIYNYNYLTIFLILIAMTWFLNDDYNIYAMAILFGILPVIKQNTGIILLLAFYIICLYEVRYEKKSIKRILAACGVSVIPGSLYIVYLLLSGSFSSFWEYAVAGIGTFSHRISYLEFAFLGIPWFILALLPWYVYINTFFYLKKNGTDKKVKHVIISVACLFIAYPLCDAHHYCVGIIPLIPILLMISKVEKKKQNTIIFYVVACLIVIESVISQHSETEGYIYSDLKNYEHILINPNTYEKIVIVDSYILEMEKKGYNVYIADESSAAYTIPLDKYRKNWDLLLVGNIGAQTVESMLDLEGDKNVFLVMRNENDCGQQTNYELIHYIKNHYKKIDEVLGFDVYEKE